MKRIKNNYSLVHAIPLLGLGKHLFPVIISPSPSSPRRNGLPIKSIKSMEVSAKSYKTACHFPANRRAIAPSVPRSWQSPSEGSVELTSVKRSEIAESEQLKTDRALTKRETHRWNQSARFDSYGQLVTSSKGSQPHK